VAVDFFTVPTISFRALFVFVVLAHHRRRHIHFNVTAHPGAEWTTQQIVQAFPWDTAPRYLIRDRDTIYGEDFRQRVQAMGIHEVLTAPRSPWQNAYAERLVGSIRRECLDHVIVLNEPSLRRILRSESRAVQPPELGLVIELPQVGGLHHRYEQRAASRITPKPKLRLHGLEAAIWRHDSWRKFHALFKRRSTSLR